MGLKSWTVTREMTMTVVVSPEVSYLLPVVMRYDIADPFAVQAEFHATPSQQVAWVFARELLEQGLRGPTGDGDVRICPSSGDGGLGIALASPDGEALVEASTAEVSDFLRQSYAVCPRGCEAEHLDIDAGLRDLLAS